MNTKSGDYVIAEDDSIVDIFWLDRFDHKTLHGVQRIPDNGLTLGECHRIALRRGYTSGVITVVEESPRAGTVYRYGNHGDFWEEVGTMDGYV